MCDPAARTMTKWLQACSNPSGSSKMSVRAHKLLEMTQNWVQKLCNAGEYEVLFTSGASESNNLILRSVIDAWLKRFGNRPHIVTSSIEHKSVLECIANQVGLKRLEVTVVNPNWAGMIDPSAVQQALQQNTALVSIMGANNETGVINPISKIAAACHERKIPFHSDCVQLFGKMQLNLPKLGIDAVSASMHKLYGPMGVGLLIIKKTVINGYKLEGQIAGTQQNGLRGGTENVPGIAGALSAMQWNFTRRAEKNKKLESMRDTLLEGLRKHFTVLTAQKLSDLNAEHKQFVVILGPEPGKMTLPNTVLLSLVNTEYEVCNGKMKARLERRGFVVAIGSACNTSSSKASHVLDALKAPPVVKRGTLRISFGDYNTVQDAKKFAEVFHQMVEKDDIWKT